MRDVVNFRGIGMIVFFHFLFECGVGIDIGVVFDSGGVSKLIGSENVVIFSFVHLNCKCDYK